MLISFTQVGLVPRPVDHFGRDPLASDNPSVRPRRGLDLSLHGKHSLRALVAPELSALLPICVSTGNQYNYLLIIVYNSQDINKLIYTYESTSASTGNTVFVLWWLQNLLLFCRFVYRQVITTCICICMYSYIIKYKCRNLYIYRTRPPPLRGTQPSCFGGFRMFCYFAASFTDR